MTIIFTPSPSSRSPPPALLSPALQLVAVVVTHPRHVVALFVAALGREVEHPVRAHHHLDATAVGRVGVEDFARFVLGEYTDAGQLFARSGRLP